MWSSSRPTQRCLGLGALLQREHVQPDGWQDTRMSLSTIFGTSVFDHDHGLLRARRERLLPLQVLGVNSSWRSCVTHLAKLGVTLITGSGSTPVLSRSASMLPVVVDLHSSRILTRSPIVSTPSRFSSPSVNESTVSISIFLSLNRCNKYSKPSLCRTESIFRRLGTPTRANVTHNKTGNHGITTWSFIYWRVVFVYWSLTLT